MSNNKQRREESMRALEKEIKSRDRSEKAKPLGVVATAAVAVLAIVGGIYWANSSGSNDEQVSADASSTATTTAEKPDYKPLSLTREKALPDSVSCDYKDSGKASKEVSKPKTSNVSAKGTVKVDLKTNKGDIDLELDRTVSPCTVNAIEHLASEGYYNNTVCHRLTTNGIFVLQCGDPSGAGSGGPGFQFANEYPTDEMKDATAPVVYGRGTIAMANAGNDTNGSQFFLNYKDSLLPPNYTYFGKISDSGLKVLDSIAEAGVKGGAADGAPAEEVKIEKATVQS
ncbi:peptidylprolyl isomerase [Corynebacterium pseudotuberculosis]|uniref:Peptidylprolyl isomerase n=1 Tax=Corynebacterium pseudotuberculosis (strain C231) TaxID=681645 RepID=D9QAR3_CORP2|nr:peptidylprolyl isomerase [Corynebacterium pseudotuberculosis]ADK28961.1 peptidylprolyl isomerase [Corynebacterium pseudotuberculosis FRC41]ADL10639.1 peptidylprolyl isomerase [Corynebacterium pseudotuberculosis C231]ADL21048.1 peptidylprolyl isomerase [Corynebacterium pseudotuberculosis 1002]ADO26438.1 peptidylprolyl isomerase [Corynebacterium pseudotuberculosis I19]AEK92502.1 Peptidyl-prolyl cis-trans isomerase B [Corynebacterium pseudotuberculosis PAT10]